jgi:hypothetical protein
MFTFCQHAQYEMFIAQAIEALEYKHSCVSLSEGWDG